jgi:hypothetical protein
MSQPSTAALEIAEKFAERLAGRVEQNRRTHAPVRRLFIQRATPDKPTPLASALRGGRGGAVRLKLELSFLWVAAKAPHDLAYPARAWATLLDLPDPVVRGARRIHEAILWLEQNKLIEVEARSGIPNVLTLRSEAGTGEPYELPGTAYTRLRKKSSDTADQHRYVQIPNTFWTMGWVSVLSGTAVAMLLVLLSELGTKNPETTDLWFSPDQADLLYGLSRDTRTKGLKELQAAGIITVRRRPIAPDTFDFQRLRNVYRLNPHRLNQPASAPSPHRRKPPSELTEL